MMRFAALCLAVFGGLLHPAHSEDITVVCNASVQFAPLFYGKESGLFARHGLNVSVQMIGLNSNIPPLLVSGSAQLGGTTSTVLLQADDNGLDLVAVAGAGIADRTSKEAALLIRSNSPINSAADLAGKTVGVPGIGAVLDVLFRNWLVEQNIDPARVQFVETDLAQQMEALRGGSVDAVIGNNPSMQRILSSGAGKIMAYFTQSLPSAVPMVVYAAPAQWAAEHRAAITAFRKANEEAIAQITAHPDEGRAALGKFVKMPAATLQDVTIPAYQADVRQSQMQTIIEIMQRQDMLHTKQDLSHLVLP